MLHNTSIRMNQARVKGIPSIFTIRYGVTFCKGKLFPTFIRSYKTSQCYFQVSPFRFLDLSGEIRNSVYQFALTDLLGFDFEDIDGSVRLVRHFRGKDENQPANQLQFVNKLLRKKTQGFASRYSNIKIVLCESFRNPPLLFFENLIDRIPKAERKHLDRITVQAHLYPWFTVNKDIVLYPPTQKIFDFCRENPNVLVRFYAQGIMGENYLALYRAHIWRKEYRNDRSYFLRIHNEENDSHDLSMLGNCVRIDDDLQATPELGPVSDNFRNLPYQLVFDRQRFLETLKDSWATPTMRGGPEGWANLVKEWYEHGL
ncbi:hypothetical protein BS50DRAFT_651703 [Corynespora cassiicola Philippines]|uniref:Uncharacterized protein n=1 Tax=Corynespora cassiicola Philippines TaxID=1448308 RepID=A0A2T2N7Q6_CORCC|nr:hypothetical protein BS50DRAFT_651703 [Corynespora cassiicola Philippines]